MICLLRRGASFRRAKNSAWGWGSERRDRPPVRVYCETLPSIEPYSHNFSCIHDKAQHCNIVILALLWLVLKRKCLWMVHHGRGFSKEPQFASHNSCAFCLLLLFAFFANTDEKYHMRTFKNPWNYSLIWESHWNQSTRNMTQSDRLYFWRISMLLNHNMSMLSSETCIAFW